MTGVLSTTGPIVLKKALDADDRYAYLLTELNTDIDNLNAAFNATTGHDHDGTDGKLIPVLAANVFIGDTANAKNAAGLTINQGAADDEVISLKSSDVAHGMTDQTETDTYGSLSKGTAANGGLMVRGMDDGAAHSALKLFGLQGAEADTTKSAAGYGVIRIVATVKSTTTMTAVGANGNMLTVENNGASKFILDADGDSHQDVGTAWTNFDEHDDIALLTALSAAVSQEGDTIREQFREYLETHREVLERARVVTFNEDNHHFVNWSRTKMVMIGAIRQLGQRWADTERRLAQMESRLALLPGG